MSEVGKKFAEDTLALVTDYRIRFGLPLTVLASRLCVSGLALLKLAGHSKEAVRQVVNDALDRNWDKLEFGKSGQET